ncbi:MAG TPA: DNA (cytosine-5-)-methyltransferase [Solirubrobacteraceae bacterium]|nr:DNA (cytosine-5-)-methyltransferase [Solirubrobacteraceae bacterium]
MKQRNGDERKPEASRRTAVKLHRGHNLSLAPHPDAPDSLDLSAVRRWVRAQARSRLTALDLFCGAGGLSLGLENAGFRVLAGADNDAHSVQTHRANIGGLGYHGDLHDPDDFLDHLRAWGIRRVDLVAGGVPCQPFSRAGHAKLRSLIDAGQRSVDDPRAGMWRSFVAVVAEMKPSAVLLENVPDLAAWDEGAVLVGFCESLRELGYRPQATILNAYEHGVPQHRSRLFIVALRPGSHFDWPAAHGRAPTVRQAIGDLPVVGGAQREERIAYGGPRTKLQRLLRSGVPTQDRRAIHDHITRDVRRDDAEAFALLPEGGTYDQLPRRLQRYRADIFSDKYKRLEWNGLSRSITAHLAKDGYWYIHPDQDRTLSVREAARIQTFPDWFRFAGQPSLRYRQIGNAVPVLLAEEIAACLHGALTRPRRRGRPSMNGQAFRSDLLAWHRDHARDFPWRRRLDPWHVLMAEVCLHRTRADQVRPVFEALSEMAPTPADMVGNATRVRAAMRSLGLRWRADNMVKIARTLVRDHAGRVPENSLALRQLPGVGDYVANAVLAFGFGQRAVIVDTNTSRIVGRVRGREGTTMRWQLRLDLHGLAGRDGPDAEFNYALLDLGAAVCRSGKPLCQDCPVARHCAGKRVAAGAAA